jgi:hypothetical protein
MPGDDPEQAPQHGPVVEAAILKVYIDLNIHRDLSVVRAVHGISS